MSEVTKINDLLFKRNCNTVASYLLNFTFQTLATLASWIFRTRYQCTVSVLTQT